MLAYDSNFAGVRCGIVDPEIVTEFSDKLFSVLRRAGFNLHPQELASANICHM